MKYKGPLGLPRIRGGPLTVKQSDILDRVFGPGVDRVQVHFHSSERMPELQNEQTHLMVTSPPYNIGWDYGSEDDEKEYNTEYLPLMARIFTEAYKKLAPGGRLCINVPNIDVTSKGGELTRGGAIPIASDFISMMVEDVGGNAEYENEDIRKLRSNTDYILEHLIIWNKPEGAVRAMRRPIGSYPYPNGLFLLTANEAILVFRKPGNRDLSKVDIRLKEASKISPSRFGNQLKSNTWDMSGSQVLEFNGEKVPTFPEELPRRLIEMFTFKGDTVVDPFAGAGTTLKVAKNMDRLSTGYETRKDLKPLIEKRVGESV